MVLRLYQGLQGQVAQLSKSIPNSAILLALQPLLVKTASLTETTSAADTVGPVTQKTVVSESTSASDTLGSITWTTNINETTSALESPSCVATYGLSVSELTIASELEGYGTFWQETQVEGTTTASDTISAVTQYALTLP